MEVIRSYVNVCSNTKQIFWLIVFIWHGGTSHGGPDDRQGDPLDIGVSGRTLLFLLYGMGRPPIGGPMIVGGSAEYWNFWTYPPIPVANLQSGPHHQLVRPINLPSLRVFPQLLDNRIQNVLNASLLYVVPACNNATTTVRCGRKFVLRARAVDISTLY